MKKLFSIFAVIIVIAAFSFFGCKKEENNLSDNLDIYRNQVITINEVKERYSLLQLSGNSSAIRSDLAITPFNSKPILGLAFKTKTSDGKEVVVAPVYKNTIFAQDNSQCAMLAFSKDSLGNIHSDLFIFSADIELNKKPWKFLSSDNFTGLGIQINEKSEFVQFFWHGKRKTNWL